MAHTRTIIYQLRRRMLKFHRVSRWYGNATAVNDSNFLKRSLDVSRFYTFSRKQHLSLIAKKKLTTAKYFVLSNEMENEQTEIILQHKLY